MISQRRYTHSTVLLLQEVDRLAKHMQDPEFCRLLAEYAKDIEDPQVNASAECNHLLPSTQQALLHP